MATTAAAVAPSPPRIRVVMMILQPCDEVEYLIRMLNTYFTNVADVHVHYNHNVRNSTIIGIESDFTIADYTEGPWLLAWRALDNTYRPIIPLRIYSKLNRFIIWYDETHPFSDLIERLVHFALFKTAVATIPSSSHVRVVNSTTDSITRANCQYFINL